MKIPRPAKRLYRILGTGWRSGDGPCWRATRQGIASRKLIQTMSGGVGRKVGAPIGWKDFLMPEKTHRGSCREAASFLFCARFRSNSAGGR